MAVKSPDSLFAFLLRREFWIGILIVLIVFGGIRLRERFLQDRGENQRPTPQVNGGTGVSNGNKVGELSDVSGRVLVTVKEGETFEVISERFCATDGFSEAIRKRNGYEGKQLKAGDRVEVECIK